MRSLRQALIVALAGGAALLGTALPTLADRNVPDIPAHRHFIQTKNGLVEVGPRFCDNSSLQQAFNQFHVNVHTVEGLDDPQGQPAPGLHNLRGAEVTARLCAFNPSQ